MTGCITLVLDLSTWSHLRRNNSTKPSKSFQGSICEKGLHSCMKYPGLERNIGALWNSLHVRNEFLTLAFLFPSICRQFGFFSPWCSCILIKYYPLRFLLKWYASPRNSWSSHVCETMGRSYKYFHKSNKKIVVYRFANPIDDSLKHFWRPDLACQKDWLYNFIMSSMGREFWWIIDSIWWARSSPPKVTV